MPLAAPVCPPAQDVLAGVYHPERLTVINACQRVAGVVEEVRVEQDGDVHYDIRVDRAYRPLLGAGNYGEQHGWLVVELMPRDGGHLPAPSVGDRVVLLGAFVDDSDHGWHELHPVFAEAINGAATHVSGPQFGGSPPADRSFDAAAGCRTPSGRECTGYTVPAAPSPPASPAGPQNTSGSSQAGFCTVSASYDSRYGDYDVYVHSNQPEQNVTVTDTAGDTRSWHTGPSGYADVYLRVRGNPAGQHVTVRVGDAACSGALP